MAAVDPALKRIVFLGPPNSGKGTQAKTLAERLGIPAISTGEMLRGAVESGSDLGRRVQAVMESGHLVDDDMMAEVIRDRLAQPDTVSGYLLDGYPRTEPQVATLDEILEERGEALGIVILIAAPGDVLVARALLRGRKDDQEEIVRERLAVYERQTAPLVGIYDGRGLLRRIDGDQSIEEVGRAILAYFDVAESRG